MRSVGLDEPIFVRSGSGSTIEDVDGNRYVDWVLSLGAAALRARRRGDARGDRRGGAARDDLRRADRARGRAGGRDRRRGPVGRDGAARLVGHRGGDERDPAGARVHPPRPDHQVRRLLPRPRRRRCSPAPAPASRRSASRRAPACPTGDDAPTPSSRPTTTSTRPPRRSSATARGSPRSSSSRWPGTWASCRPRPGFLEALRALCDASGALLIFDEVITGFRVARGGAQERFGVLPDLTILGKIVGGGLPARRVRRPRRRDGAARSGRRGLPGRHAVREPARDRGGDIGTPPSPRR